VPTATPVPPPPPTATTLACQYGDVGSNPWCYNFTCCSYIYSPPGNFCGYFPWIPSFWDHTNGYVEVCQDGDYCRSGERSRSCSYHGGKLRALLAL
jgi:hypothetical protein